MSVRSYLREFEDSIYDLVYTDDWTKVEEKMEQDESFTELLLTFVEASLAEDASQSARIRISKTSHPIKKERLLAEETARNTHLAAIEKRQQLERELSQAFLGEHGIQEDKLRREELACAWARL
jgi:predicted transcriptional regulator